MINRNRNSAVDRARAEMKQAVNSSRRQLNCVRDSQDTFASTTEFLNAIDTAINSNPRMGINRKCGEINQLISIAADSEGCDQSVVKKVDRLFDNFMNSTANNTSAASMAENFKKLNDKIQALNSNCSSSRHMSYKTRKAVEYSINCARRRARLNCEVARYAGNEEYQTYYFITADNSFVASFDVEIHENEIEFAGFMRGYSAGGYVVNENSVFGEFAPGTDVAQALADFVYDKTGVTVYETENVKEFNNQLLNINKIFTNSRKSRIEKYTELRRAGYGR